MNPYSALEDSNEPIDPTNVEFFKFTALVSDVKVSLQEDSFDNSKYPATVSLITVSNKHGHVAAATTSGFILDTTKSLRQTFYSAEKGTTVPLTEGKISVPLKSAIHQIRFSAEETQLLVATEGGKLLVYNVNDINNNKENTSPIQTFDLGQDIIDLRPNPEALPNLAAVLFKNHQCKIIDITNGSTVSHLSVDNISAICWSPKGKQIVCGKLDGGLQHFDANGVVKAELSIPKLMSTEGGQESKNRYVQDVLWIENHIFLVLYSRCRETEHDEFLHDGYIINRKPANGSNVPEYIHLAEITPIFSDEGRGNHFYMELIRNLGKEVKHAVIIANAATSELTVVGQDENGEWATWDLPENGVASFPLSDETSMDTFPLGLAIDFTVDEPLPPLDASEGETGVNPMPVFYFINDEGHIGAYHCYNIEIARRNEPYSITASFTGAETNTAAPAVTKAPEVAAPSQPSGFAAFGSASSSSNTGSFGDLLSGKSESPTVGFGGGFGGSIPSFSNLGSAQKIPATPSTGFGAAKAAPTAALPAFGTTTNVGFFSSKPVTTTADKPLSSFGITSNKAEAAPAFGSTSFGSKQPTTSAFGSTSTTTGFGSTSTTTGFGSTSTATGLGSTSTTTGFGSTSTTTGFGSTSTQPTTTGFGSTSTLGGFGSLALNKVPGATNPTTAPSFGSTSAVGGFGSLALNKVPGATNPTTTPATGFGSTSTLGGGFGALALNKVPGATNPTTTPATGFGSSTTAAPATGFGSSATTAAPATGFGSSATTPAPATGFGSSATTAAPATGFGSSATTPAPATGFGSSTKPTGFEATKFASSSATTVVPIPAPTFGSTNTLGSGGFGSLAKNTVPGAVTPTSKPLFGAPSSLGSFGSSTTTQAESSTTKPIPKSKEDTTTSPPFLESKPSVESKSSTPVESKPSTESKPTKEKLKVTAESGMAREYESIYIKVTEGIEELSFLNEKISKAIAANSSSSAPKTEQSLKDKNSTWNLNDVAEYGALTQSLIESSVKDQPDIMKESLQTLSINCKKSMDKKEDIKYLLQKEINSDVVDLIDKRELDPETKQELNTIENKAEAYSSILSNLEFKVQEYKKRNKIKSDHSAGNLTLYSLHRAVRDIQKDIVGKKNELTELENKFANIKLNDSRRKAQQSSTGFSCQDISDSEDDDEEDEITTEAIEQTTNYFRRFNFLGDLCEKTSARTPLQCPVE